MFETNQQIILILLIVILAWWVLSPSAEGFDANMMEFVPVESDRYGLRGDKLRRRNIDDYYISSHRQMRLNHSTGLMYESNLSPEDEGISGCRKVKCPTGRGEYDDKDTCWKCGDECQQPMNIPDIWPHTS